MMRLINKQLFLSPFRSTFLGKQWSLINHLLMASYTPRIRAGEQCLCKNGDPLEFRHYWNTDVVYLGKFCKQCRKEWLTPQFLTGASAYEDGVDGISPYTALSMGTDLYLIRNPEDLANVQFRSARIRAGEPCLCMDADPLRYTQLWNPSGIRIGKTCQRCHKDWFTKDHLNSLSGSNDQCEGPMASRAGTELASDLYLRKQTKLEENTAFLVRCDRTKIRWKHYADMLKPGDHISWHRIGGWWHHAIVHEIDARNNEIVVIQWNNTKYGTMQIVQESLPVVAQDEKMFNKMFRIEYSGEVLKANPTELVLARAMSRISDTGYWITTDNCESFATYCKTGVEQSHQIAWLKRNAMQHLGEIGMTVVIQSVKAGIKYAAKVSEIASQTPVKTVHGEFIEWCNKHGNEVEAGIVVLVETGFVIWDISHAYGARKEGKATRKVFVEATVGRVIEGLSGAGLTVPGICAGSLGIFVGWIIGGVICGVLRKVIGTWLGNVTGNVIATYLRDDRAITNIGDLKRADHIVFTGWCLHPRCHAIVVKHNENDEIEVIRNTYEKGVVCEWMAFQQPMYRVEYDTDECCDPDTVIKNAKARIGNQQYSLGLYNCKTFARECKTKGVSGCRKLKTL